MHSLIKFNKAKHNTAPTVFTIGFIYFTDILICEVLTILVYSNLIDSASWVTNSWVTN